MKGRKERAQDEGCLGRSRVASKRGRAFDLFRPFLFSLRGWLLSVVGWDGCGAPEENKIGGLTGVSGFWRGAGVGLVGACALMQPSQGSRVAPVEVRRVRGGSVDGGSLLGSVGVMVAVGPVFGAVLSLCVVGCCGCSVRMGAAKSETAKRGSRRRGRCVAVAGSGVNGRA